MHDVIIDSYQSVTVFEKGTLNIVGRYATVGDYLAATLHQLIADNAN